MVVERLYTYPDNNDPRNAPEYTGHTCRLVDNGQELARNIIEQFEELRRANEQIRDWGKHWRDNALSYKDQLNAKNEELEATKRKLAETEHALTLLRQHNDRVFSRLPEGVLLPAQEELDAIRQVNGPDIRGELARCDGCDLGGMRKEADDIPF